MSDKTTIVARYGDDDDLPERRRQPFVPSPHRVHLPADPSAIQRADVDRFDAEFRVETGGQLTRRLIRNLGALEEEIRARALDDVHYTLMEQVLATYAGDGIQVRHQYMNPEYGQRRYR